MMGPRVRYVELLFLSMELPPAITQQEDLR